MLGKKTRWGDAVCEAHLPLDNDSERIMNMDIETDLTPSHLGIPPQFTGRHSTFMDHSIAASTRGSGQCSVSPDHEQGGCAPCIQKQGGNAPGEPPPEHEVSPVAMMPPPPVLKKT